MTNLIIIRGLPGSGKSTYASKLFPNYNHFEADQFFQNDNQEYVYDNRLIKFAHEWCFSNVIKSLYQKIDTVVSNTFVELWSLQRYLSIEKEFGIDVNIKIIEMKTQYNNIHNVPVNVLERMKKNWQEIPDSYGIDVFKVGN